MTDQNEALEAPAPAVAAGEGANQGSESPANPNHTTPAPTAESEGAANANAQASADDGEAEHDGDSDEGEGEGPADAQAGGEGASTDPTKKKRRRRRRKKPGAGQPGAEGAEGVQGAASVGDQGGEPRHERPAREGREGREGREPREGQGGVFARFFDGPNAGKRHAFSVGEVVAGRVSKINDGAFAVDLFGKATAYVDIFEPHEVPVIPDPPPAPEPAPAVEGQAATSEGVAQETPAESADAAPAAAEASEQTAASSDVVSAVSADAVPAAPVAESAPADAVATPVADAASAVDAQPTAEAPAAEAQPEHAEAGEHHDDGGHEEAAAEPEPEPPPPPELGTIFRGRIGSVAESGHVAIVNRIIDVPAAKQRIAQAREQRRRVRGVVFGFNRGGFDVLVEGIRVFCPASGMFLGSVESPDQVLGQRLEFTVPPAKAGTHGFVVSRRGILERQQRKAAKQLLRSLQPGQRLKGRVTQVREFGLFVDLGGIEGLVHQSELSFNRGVRPNDVAKPGDEVEVQVLRVGEGQTRKERERVSLSMKTLQADPWGAHKDVLEPGNVINGKVVRTTEFGAFIEIAPMIEGLLHISELGRELKHANQVLQEGQELRVVVERVDRNARRISLSKLSQAEEKALETGGDAKSARPPKPGQHLTVAVEKVEQMGLIVQVPGVFGRRGRGFIPNAEMGTERGTDHRKGFPPGTQIPVKVIGIDRDGGFRFSRKALVVEEEKRAIQDYRREAARQGLGTFGDLLRAKLEGTKQS